ncbi:hypothetical protein CAter282_1030 [Collimonas arenae]|uniref:DUF2726 domain-containing protein n=1 Tax=Collimonas arenae TaxID=279058 RepID=A0A127PNE4_9BURK|nr:DUF2726 domain-containing protein [Collimonas arenae]AMO98931.1 hypothetical protein CAter10_1115 [Collimonas arenae]AMP08825.1 hypothetical protein CAter282_1030 [Collimonas arenae]
MKAIIALAVLTIIMMAVIAVLTREKQATVQKRREYVKKKPLSNNEQVMYWRLIGALPDHMVLTQVSLGRCLGTKDSVGLDTLTSKSLDFVICDKASDVVAVVELDNKTHNHKTFSKEDEKKYKALKNAGIDIIRWRASSLPSEADIRERFTLMDPTKKLRAVKAKTHQTSIFGIGIGKYRNTGAG